MRHVPRMHWPEPLAVGATVDLPAARAHHLTRVLRRRPGETVILFQEPDREFDAELIEADQRSARVRITAERVIATESPLPLILIQGISRGDRMDYSVQKSVELGVHAIQPVFTERSGVKLDAGRLKKKQDHWQAVALSAAEQSGRTRVPPVQTALRLHDYLRSAPGTGFVLAPATRPLPATAPTTQASIPLLVGPEGGLTEAEVAAATAAGFSPLQLGPRILRTETAGAAAIAALQTRWGDWT